MNNNFEILLKCDISGIQPFIFNVPSTGAAKELKNRSMYVQSIADSCLKELESFFVDETVKILYNGGGNFYMEISTNKTEDEIHRKISDIQSFYLESDIFPFIAFVAKSSNLFDSINDVNKVMQKAKMQRPLTYETLDAKPIKVPTFNINEIKSINGQVPKGDFTWIANQSEGDKKLAALKLDIDNLGTLFMDKSESEYKIISEKIKDFFDKDMLKLIKDENLQQNIYVVFSGGDDCFLIGSWNKILEFAIILRKKFFLFQEELRKQVKFKEDKEITFSAGIEVFSSHYPMLQMAEEVEVSLTASKHNKIEYKGVVKEKNSVTIFGKTLTWDEFEKSKSLSETFYDLIKNRNEPKSLLMIFRLVYPNENELPKVWKLKYFLRRNIKEANFEIIKPIFADYEQALLFHYLKIYTKRPIVYLVASRWAELLMK